MSHVIMIGVPGDSTVYVADLEAGTVRPVDAASTTAASANRLRDEGPAYVKGVDFAVAVRAAEPAAAGLFDAH